ncbi:R3H domain-containing protein 1-like isoform X3 [Biomphalaria glabrata]|uniref:R3H domain-containing protein 1-like isoform X3 n=1 Tax=Biomphalaria glabrata TaxID=6526 RepID=A0A9W2YA60_BIOGL|nr:R3H domain-containing protein 1-like isoform X3 [Biomphalaria glabrata]
MTTSADRSIWCLVRISSQSQSKTKMSENEKRCAKLHKQTEVEVYDEDPSSKCLSKTASPVCAGVPTPTVQPASSSSETSPDDPVSKPVPVPPQITRKQTLIRTQALEGTSPPPESFFSQIRSNGPASDSLLTNGTAEGNKGTKNKYQSSSQEAKEYLLTSHKVSSDSGLGTLDNNDGSSDTSVLSRDSSLENASLDCYKDSSGVNIPKFIRETLLKGPKDKKTVLTIEAQLLDFIKSDGQVPLKTSEMTSYDRMIVHRLSAYLGLDHNVDTTGKSVVVNKTDKTRAVKLTDLILGDVGEEPKKKILLKKPASLDEKHGRHTSKNAFGSHRAKSLEERQQFYTENLPDGIRNPTSSHLSPDYIPQMNHQQRSQDIVRLTSKWASQESSGYESMKDSPTAHYMGPPSLPYTCPMPGLPLDQSHMPRSTPDSPHTQSHQYPTTYAYLVSSDYSSIPVGSLIINPHTMWLPTQSYPHSYEASITYVQPHVNSDGSLYHFDPSCPPPFMVAAPPQPPPPTPPVGNVVYHTVGPASSESVSELNARLAATTLSPVEPEAYTVGQPVPVMPTTILQHPHPVYTATHPSQYAQGQYYTPQSPAAGQQVRYVTYGFHPQSQQPLLQATPVEGQGQTTVPMPAVGIPPVAGPGGFQVIGPPFSNASLPPGQATPQCVDLSSVYHYTATAETVVSSANAVTGSPVAVTTPTGLLQAFNLGYPSQPQQPSQHPVAHGHQGQFTPCSVTPTGTTYYAVPVSTPTPSQTLAPPPPSSHHFQPLHQQHQQTVFYTPSNLTVTPVNYPVPVSNPSQSSTSSFKSIPAQYLANNLRSLTPPQQQHPQHLQPSSAVAAVSSNGHHSAPLTLNYGQPMNFPASQTLPPQGASQLVTFQGSSYQVRPVSAMIQLNPAVQQPQMSYQIYRPAGNITDFKLMTQGALHRQPSLPGSNQQPRPKGSNPARQAKKGQKKPGTRDGEDYPVGQQRSTAPQNVALTLTPLIPSSLPQTYQQMPSTSNRQ